MGTLKKPLKKSAKKPLKKVVQGNFRYTEVNTKSLSLERRLANFVADEYNISAKDVEINIEDEDQTAISINYEVTTANREEDGQVLSFNFDRDQLPYCCGVIELGGLGEDSDMTMDNGFDDDVPEDIVVDVVALAFKNFIEENSHHSKNRGHLYIINALTDVQALIINGAIKAGFTKLKTFMNAGSGNSITTLTMFF
jgi:hypothetical protein